MQDSNFWHALRSIRRTIPVAVVLPMLLGILLTGYITYQNIELAIEDLSAQLRVEINASVSRGADRFLRAPQQILDANSIAVARNVLPVRDIPESSPWRNHLLSQAENHHVAQFIAYRSVEGRLIQVGRDSEDEVWLIANTQDGLVHSQKRIDPDTWESLRDAASFEQDLSLSGISILIQ